VYIASAFKICRHCSEPLGDFSVLKNVKEIAVKLRLSSYSNKAAQQCSYYHYCKRYKYPSLATRPAFSHFENSYGFLYRTLS